ncbi:SusC/RagA family TonB-linked outer membrane protein [Niastella vici]|uniref:SusC/RagA family TonB-linked outer membrane protein n=1 Tax=Niastella vici TaxID=1703345 RepID=A0A1V9FFY9_9BACT|nr:SusC/RagA family TonB-linked outer membrane protein [Niastella vici]OQP57278.1 SusC/RagA family TonB-linked outer membrane protein [Niastella vici]
MKDAKRRTLMVLLFCFWVGIVMAQQKRTISGTVIDPQGDPVPGATLLITGTNNASVTDAHGRFSISIDNPNAILVVSSINFKRQEVKIGQSSVLKIVLEASETGLEDVVVTALGIKREKKAVGYATATVKGEDLVKAGATLNPFLAMYGKAAGVGINISSAGPTGGVNVRIRGAAGLESNTNTRPLFVVDGVPLYDEKTSMESRGYDPLNSFDYGSGVNDINSDDIESIEILKGAKATVLYGSQALNGVVLITTKSGKKTRGLGIQLSHQVTIDKPFTYIDFQNDFGSGASIRDTQYAQIGGVNTRKLPLSRFSFGPRFDNSRVMLYDSTMGTYKAYPNNFIDFFNTAVSNRTNIAIAGGGTLGSVRASYTRNSYEDIIPGFTQKQNTFSFNGNFKVSEFATFEFVNNLYSVQTKNRRPNIQQFVATGLNRDYDYNWMKSFYHDQDGFKRDLDPYGLADRSPGYWPNAVAGIMWEQNDNKDQDNKIHLVSSVRSTLQFTKNISLLAQASLDYTNTDFITENKITRLAPVRSGGKYSWSKRNTTVQNFQALMKYEKTFHDFNFFAFGGGAYQKVAENSMYSSTGEMGLLFPDWYSLGNADTRFWPTSGDRSKVTGLKKGSDVLYSVLGSATLSWKETYYLEMQARNDWNSTLKAPNYAYFYPGLSLTYNFYRDFTIPKLQYGKLRLAWADVGGGPTTAVGDRYFANDAYSVGQLPYSYGPITVAPPSALFLEPLKPFRKREFEIGFNTRWFERSRVEFDVSFYTNNTYNQIVQQPITPATGYTAAKINTGNVKNWGLEFLVKGAPIATQKYRWDLTFTAANQFSKVVKLYPGITQKYIDGNSGFQVWAKEGERIGEIRAYDYKRDPNGNKIVSGNGLYALSDQVTGTGKNVNPKVFGGLYSDFSFKGFNFHFGIDYKFGGTIFSYTNNYLMGTGVIKASLHGRDEATGGQAYYIDNASGANVSWEHNKQAPANARDGIVYHDGIVLDGVKEVNTGGTVKYEKNDVIIAAPAYYQTYISDNSTSWPPDRLFKNDYVKLREVSIEYSLPKKVSSMLKLQKLSLTAAARNLGYLYKTLPNIDPEGALGAQGYIENSFYPSIRSFSFGVNVSF